MAEDKKEDLIDLDKLSQRELLIICARDVKELKSELATVKSEQHNMALKVNTMETKSKVWGSVAGFITGLLAVAGEKLLIR